MWLALPILVLILVTLYQSYEARQQALDTAKRAEQQVECQAEFNRLFYKISKGRSELANEERLLDRRSDRAFDQLINSIVLGSNTNNPQLIGQALNDYQATRNKLNEQRAELEKKRAEYVYPPLSQEGSCD